MIIILVFNTSYKSISILIVFRMVLNEASIYIGLMCGSLLSSYLLAATNTVTVFICSASVLLIAIMYVVRHVGESVDSQQLENSVSEPKSFHIIQYDKLNFRIFVVKSTWSVPHSPDQRHV